MSNAGDAKLSEYEVVVAQFRALAETRFKLISFLPVGSLGALLYLQDKATLVSPVALFGALITFALYIYHLRNDQLYKELVSRAGQLELELGLLEGGFLQRPAPWVALVRTAQIEHGWPIQLIYAATVNLWLFFGIRALGGSLLTTPLSMAVSAVVVVLIFGAVSSAEKRCGARLTRAVENAMDVLTALPNRAPMPVAEFEEVASTLRRDLGEPRSSQQRFMKRFQFYFEDHNYRRYIDSLRVTGALGNCAASRLLALVIDQPARWILDVYTGRRA